MIVERLPCDPAFLHDIFHRQLFDLLLHQKPFHSLYNQFFCPDCHLVIPPSPAATGAYLWYSKSKL